MWDAETGVIVSGPFRGHNGWVNSVAFSPDGKQVVSGSGDKTIQVWDAETGVIVSGPFKGHNDGLTLWHSHQMASKLSHALMTRQFGCGMLRQV